MPLDLSVGKTPKGRDLVMMRAFGVVELTDAEKFEHGVKPGGPLEGMPQLSLVEEGVSYTADARKSLTRSNADAPSAVITKNSGLRLLINLIVKANNLVRKKPMTVRFFATRDEGLTWLDQELDRREQAKGATAA